MSIRHNRVAAVGKDNWHMSIATRANLWGNGPPADRPHRDAPVAASLAPLPPRMPHMPSMPAALRLILEENGRLVDRVRALSEEMRRLQEQVRQLEAR